jgi:PTH1 family peptidyl-tRNA hydrolase
VRLPGASARVGTPCSWLIVGLGNPGTQYDGTRHNVGADAIHLLVKRHGGTLKVERHQRAELAEVTIAGTRVALAIPTTFMNESGAALRPLEKRTGVALPSQLVVVHDELDLAPGVVRVKDGGGLAGHNGLRSIVSVLGDQSFARVRIGIGKPPSKEQGANHVLSKLSKAAREELDAATVRAADAVELLIAQGLERAMNATNQS